MTYDPIRNVLTVCACPYCKEAITQEKGCDCQWPCTFSLSVLAESAELTLEDMEKAVAGLPKVGADFRK